MCKVKKTDDPESGQLSLLKIPILVDKEAVLNEIPVREAMDFYTMDDICEHINDEEYLERCDMDEMLTTINDEYPGKMEEYLKEQYSNE
jgi:hypothetical protein